MFVRWRVDEPVKAEMYLPYAQIREFAFYTPRDLVIRTSIDPLKMVAAARNEIHQVIPAQPISDVRTMDEVLGKRLPRGALP